MVKHNISVNPVKKKKPSPVKDKIEFFNNLSRTSDSQESPSKIGLASRSIPSTITHIDNKNQLTPSAPPSFQDKQKGSGIFSDAIIVLK